MERKPFGRVNVTPACAGLGSLVDDLLEQIGAGLGECELAEARIDGSAGGVAVSPRVGCGSGFLSGSCRIVSLCSVVPSS